MQDFPRPEASPPAEIPALAGCFYVPSSSGEWWARPATTEVPGALFRVVNTANGRRPVEVSEIPEVTAHLVARDRAGRIIGRRYGLRWANGETRLVDDPDLARHETYTPGRVAPHDPRTLCVLADAIDREPAARVPEVDQAPRHVAGRLELPPAEHGPAGYGETATDDETEARATWRQLAALAADHPKLALVAGAALAGCYLDALDRPAFILHLVGDTSEGKTSGLTLAAAVLGNPDLVLSSWNRTSVAMGRHLARLAVLPAVVDELGAGALNPSQLEALILRVSEGAERETATRTGTGTVTSGRWRSVLISSGNRGLSNVTKYPGLPVRAIDLPTPITDTGEAADTCQTLARAGAGWPLRWALEDDPAANLDHLRRLIARAETELAAPAHVGALVRIARHLAACVAGAVRLGWLISGPSVADQLGAAAMAAAVELLADREAEMGEHGRMADQLIDAICEARLSRPHAFPPRHLFPDNDGSGPARILEGFEEPDAGTLSIFKDALARIVVAAGIEDPRPGLLELRRRGVLEAEPRHLTRRAYFGPSRATVYTFRTDMGADPRATPAPIPAPPSPHSPWSTGGPAPPAPVFTYGRVVELENEAAAAAEAERAEAAQTTARLAELYEAPTLGAIRARTAERDRWAVLGRRLAALPDRLRFPIECRLDVEPLEALEAAVTAAETPPAPTSPARVRRRPDGPVRAPREPLALDTRRARFTRAAIRCGLDPTPAEAAAGLDRLEAAARLSFEQTTAATAGIQWLHALRHGPPPTEPIELPKIRASFTLTDPTRAEVGSHLVVVDRNASYANAAQSLELGSGPTVVIERPQPVELRAPGFVTLFDVARSWPAPFCRLQAGERIWTPLAALLVEQDPSAVEVMADLVTWPQHRRWLRPFARRCLDARAALMADPDPANLLALAVLKRIYSATLGGFLRASRYNRTAYLRRDWAGLVEAAATAGMWRQLARARPGPALVALTDAAAFTVDHPDDRPNLEISDRPGKWKLDHVCPMTDRIRADLRSGHAGAALKHAQPEERTDP